jgi:hypothetical protein
MAKTWLRLLKVKGAAWNCESYEADLTDAAEDAEKKL